MNLTLEDIKEKMKQLPEIDLLELLEIDSEMLVDRFYDIIEDKIELIAPEFEYEEEEREE
jgi:hypothetical protein